MATFAEKTPNYNTPEGEQLIKVAIAFIVFQTVFLVLFYASKYIQSKDISGIEMTFFMPLGFIFCVGNSVLSILFVEIGGVGHHISKLDYPTIIMLAKLFKAEEMVYLALVMFPKLAILSLFIRLFLNPIRKMSYVTAAVVIASFVSGFLTWALACRPFAFNWNKTISGGTCINTNFSYAYFSIPNLLSDVAIILLPLYPLWNLQVPRSTRVGLFFTFMLGGVGIITAIIRFVTFAKTNINADPSFHGANTMRWTIIELAMYQIAATLPTLRPILNKSMKAVEWATSISLSRLQRTGEGQQTGSHRDHFVKLDDYPYSKDSRGTDVKHLGVLRTTDVSISTGFDGADQA